MARRDEVRQNRNDFYIETIKPTGYDVLINGTSKYLNFNTVSGFLGYGFRDNAGTMEFKNSGGAWEPFLGSGSLGIDSINGLTATAQFLANGATGLAPAFVSATDTHTLNIPLASGAGVTSGTISKANFDTFNGKQNAISLTTVGSSGAATFIADVLNIPDYSAALTGYVPTSRTLTINGTTFDLSANRTWSVGDALVANPLSQFASTTSAQLAGVISDETGSGALVFANTPTFTSSTTKAFTGVGTGGQSAEFHLVATAPTAGLAAPIGSWATDNQRLYVKFNSGDANRAIPVMFDPMTSYVQNPLSYLGGSFNLTFNTAGGKFQIGDAANVANRTNLTLQDTAQEFQFATGGSQRRAAGASAFTFSEAYNFAFGTATGTKIGTATSQKIGFFNASPVVQQTGDISSALSALGLVIAGTLGVGSITGGAALTRVDDTNVTMTLGGNPTTALLMATSMTLGWTGQLSVPRGGTGLASVAQGDILYGSASNVLSALAKSTSSTRYLSNTGTSNNPAWAQIDLTNGVTGVLPVANGGTATSTQFTLGSVIFAGASGVYTQDNANFFRDDTNNRLGIGTTTPDQRVHSEVDDSQTNRVIYPLRVTHTCSGTVTTNFGAGMEYELENASGTNIVAGETFVRYTDAVAATEDAEFQVRLVKAGTLGTAFSIQSSGAVAATDTMTITQPTLGNVVQNLNSTATNDDPTELVYQNRVATTDNTQTTLHTFTVPASTTYAIEATVIARRTGGVAGTAEDGARYKLYAVYKNVAGTATIIGSVTQSPVDESQVGRDATFTVTGATVLCRVTGATNNNIVRHMTSRVYQVST